MLITKNKRLKMITTTNENLNKLLDGEGSIKEQYIKIQELSDDDLIIAAETAKQDFAKKFAQREYERRQEHYFFNKLFPSLLAVILTFLLSYFFVKSPMQKEINQLKKELQEAKKMINHKIKIIEENK